MMDVKACDGQDVLSGELAFRIRAELVEVTVLALSIQGFLPVLPLDDSPSQKEFDLPRDVCGADLQDLGNGALRIAFIQEREDLPLPAGEIADDGCFPEIVKGYLGQRITFSANFPLSCSGSYSCRFVPDDLSDPLDPGFPFPHDL